MLLTRIWGVILACLATFFLGGMFLVAASGDEDFTEADEAAIRAITEAGAAALEAQFVGHPVQHTPSVLDNPKVQARLAVADDAIEAGQATLGELVAELTEGLRVRYGDATLTVALLDAQGAIKAANGGSEPDLPELLGSDALAEVKPDTEALFSIMLGGSLHVAKVSKPNDQGYRVIGVGELDTSAGSTFRRVLGSTSPAALVRKGKVVGAIIGDQPVAADLEAMGRAHVSDTPAEGASKTFMVGEGMDARIGALGRIPGPAGRGNDGLLLVVLSGKTAAAGQKDLASALRRARENNRLTQVNFVLLLGLLVVTAGLAAYLPTLEGTGPLNRLKHEFDAMARGTQHALFHDRYGGPFGALARSANAAHDALRHTYLAELEIEEEEFEANPTAPRSRPMSGRVRKPTRAHRRATADTASRTAGRAQAAGPRLRSSQARSIVESPIQTPIQSPIQAPIQPPASAAAPVVQTPAAPPPSAPARAPSTITAPSAVVPRAAPVVAVPSPVAPTPTPVHPSPAPVRPPPAPEPSLALTIDELSATYPIHQPPGSFRPPTTGAPSPASDADNDAYYREVYEEFLQVKQACGESTTNFTYEKFAAKLGKQTSDIKQKRPGVAEVRFTVYVKDGKAALRAKVIKA